MSLSHFAPRLRHRIIKISLMLAAVALLQACAGAPQSTNYNYDFGAVSREQKLQPIAMTMSIADISAPGTLDGNAMLYRLQYDNQQLLRPYAQHHWSMPPAQLLTQRLKSRIAAAGGTVVGTTDGIADLPVLKIDLDEFSQVFTSATQSEAHISFRASVIRKNKLIAQRYFNLGTTSDSADARGGAKAMQITADASITSMLAWLQNLPLN
jgi:cholesterol transport system auxiliary component